MLLIILSQKGERLFTVGHFDLIIIDESHVVFIKNIKVFLIISIVC